MHCSHQLQCSLLAPPNGYNKSLIASSCMHCSQRFNCLLLLRLLSSAYLISVSIWMVYKWCHLAWKADSQQEITTWLASVSCNGLSYILCMGSFKYSLNWFNLVIWIFGVEMAANYLLEWPWSFVDSRRIA